MFGCLKDGTTTNCRTIIRNAIESIGKDGHVSNVYLLKGIEDFSDAYLIQLAHKMLWTPAQQNGRNIETYQDIEILLN